MRADSRPPHLDRHPTSAAGTVRIHGAREPQQPAEKTIPDQVRLFIPFTAYPAEDNKRILDMYTYLRVVIAAPSVMFSANLDATPYLPQYGVTADGQRFLGLDTAEREQESFTFLLNFLQPGSVR
jgi:hypothetical protein